MDNNATTTIAKVAGTVPQQEVETLSTRAVVHCGCRGRGGPGGLGGLGRQRGRVPRTRSGKGYRRNLEKYLIESTDRWVLVKLLLRL